MTDAADICAVYNQAIAESTSTFETEQRTESERRTWMQEHDVSHPILVAVMEGRTGEKVVAWASIQPYRPRACYSGVGEISLYVHEGYRGRGVGTHLMMALIEEAKSLGYWKLLSRTFSFNVASRALCKSCGFREVGVYLKHGKLNERWIDAVIVELLIPENLT